MNRSEVIFGNPIDKKTVRAAQKSKNKYLKKYGDDREKDYRLAFQPIPTLDFLQAQNIVLTEGESATFPQNALIVGNIRMGFGHYRISIAMASCAKALGYTPYWLDLAGLDTTGSKMIREQNDLYSLASRISQKSKLFNSLVWEPMNRDGFKALTYNAKDQANSELLAPIFRNIPKDVPYIATHVWPAQGAIHGGLTRVVNAIPDNWPMALHLAEGAMHAVQTPFAYMGYKALDGFADTPLRGIPADRIRMVGHYVDHELLVNLQEDNARRRERIRSGAPVRILLTVGGAGAGQAMFLSLIRYLLPLVREKKVCLFVNFGDHTTVYEYLSEKLPEYAQRSRNFFDDYEGLKEKVKEMRGGVAEGIVSICNKNVFQAVYSTNLLMPECDFMITKPSELVFYPIPKIFQRHIGGHEVYGGIHGRELGDATYECESAESLCAMTQRLLTDKESLLFMIDRIDQLQKQGWYDGGYECVRLATAQRE